MIALKTQTPLGIGPNPYGVCYEENAIPIISSKINGS
jgi:hypothetical protein